MNMVFEPARFRDESRTKRNKRRLLLSTAEHLFRTKGIAGTSMIDIAKISEVERRTLYNYYNNKEEIAIDIQIEYLKSYGVAVKFEIDEQQNAKTQLKAYCDAYIDRFINNREFINYITQFDYYFRDYEPEGVMSIYYNSITHIVTSENAAVKLLNLLCKQKEVEINAETIKKFFLTLHHCMLGVAQRVIFREQVYEQEQGFVVNDIKLIIPILVNGIIETLTNNEFEPKKEEIEEIAE